MRGNTDFMLQFWTVIFGRIYYYMLNNVSSLQTVVRAQFHFYWADGMEAAKSFVLVFSLQIL